MMKLSSEMSFFDVAISGLQGHGPPEEPQKRGGLQQQPHVTQISLDGFEQNLGRFLGTCMSLKYPQAQIHGVIPQPVGLRGHGVLHQQGEPHQKQWSQFIHAPREL